MKRSIFTLVIITLLSGFGVITSNAQFMPAGNKPGQQPAGNKLEKQFAPFFLSGFSAKLDARLKNKSVGYSYAIVDRAGNVVGGGGGDARRTPDTNPRKMTMNDKLNIASVSKTITAAAVLQLLHQKKISVDAPVFPYLPPKWVLGERVKTITFRELLTHRSGIRCDKEVTFLNLRECVATGVKLSDKGVEAYRNTNFALFRLIIPRLNGFDGGTTADTPIGNSIASGTYAAAYSQYVRNNVFAPAGLTGIDTKPIATNPALTYQFPAPQIAGESHGDMTETSASRGWNMSARQLALFFHALFNTEKILPLAVSKRMREEQLGVWKDATTLPPLTSWEHGGHYPGKNKQGAIWNNGELNSLGITFSNGVSVAVIVNSQFGPGQEIVHQVKAVMKEFQK